MISSASIMKRKYRMKHWIYRKQDEAVGKMHRFLFVVDAYPFRRPVLGELEQRILYDALTLKVKCTRRLIKNQDRRVLQEDENRILSCITSPNRIVPEIRPIKHDFSRCDIIEPRYERDQCGFAAPAHADECDGLPAFDIKVDVFHRIIIVVHQRAGTPCPSMRCSGSVVGGRGATDRISVIVLTTEKLLAVHFAWSVALFRKLPLVPGISVW